MNFDYTIFTKINGLAGHHKLLDFFMLSISKYGILLYGLILLYMWFKPGAFRENKKAALKGVLAALIALAINQIIGFFYFRPRPFANHRVNMLISKSPDPSFPSDHATGSSALTLSFFGTEPLIGVVMTFITVLLMISRIYVGTHYPLDVIGGAVTGILGNIIANYLWPYLDGFFDKAISIYNKYIPI